MSIKLIIIIDHIIKYLLKKELYYLPFVSHVKYFKNTKLVVPYKLLHVPIKNYKKLVGTRVIY